MNIYFILGLVIPITIATYKKCINWFNYPKSMKRPQSIARSFTGDCKKIGFNQLEREKLGDNIDAILIGSGIGSLICASSLAKLGWKVVVLEQHDVAGGCTHTFKDGGYEFDTGIHYIGDVSRDVSKRQNILDILGSKKIQWVSLGPVYDVFYINGKKYEIPTGEQNLLDYLTSLFPEESENIRNYLNYCKQVSKKDWYFILKIVKPTWLRKWLLSWMCQDFFTASHMSVTEGIRLFTENIKLIELLSGLSIDGGPPPEKQSFFMHASIVNHFLEGGFYPVGGPSVFADSLIPTIQKSGGQVFVNCTVTQIQTDHYGRASGVKYTYRKKEYYLASKTIISGIGLRNTVNITPDYFRTHTNIWKVLKSVPGSITYNFLFLGLNRSSEDLHLPKYNTWIWNTPMDDMVRKFEQDPLHNPAPLFIASSSAKDPSCNKSDKSTLVAITWSAPEIFPTGGNPRHRSDDYNEIKEQIQTNLLKQVLQYYPQIKDHIDYQSFSTPETVKYYLGSANGECYGLDAIPARFAPDNMIFPDTIIPGLYLTGQDVTTLGFTGAMMSGILTANTVAGYGSIMDILSGKELISDLTKNKKN